MNLKESLKSIKTEEQVLPKTEETPIEKKKRRGRPSVSHKQTKLYKILESRGMTRKMLYEKIAKKYPDEPISPDALSRIISGKRRYYSTTTLFRICGALGISPNMCLDWEDELYGHSK
jgi:DNA-binding Xre family transcriptional regulator